MCLSIPGRIEKINDDTAVANISGNKVEVNTQLMDEIKIGDYVLVHTGFAIEKLSEEEARKTLQLFKELEEQDEGS